MYSNTVFQQVKSIRNVFSDFFTQKKSMFNTDFQKKNIL